MQTDAILSRYTTREVEPYLFAWNSPLPDGPTRLTSTTPLENALSIETIVETRYNEIPVQRNNPKVLFDPPESLFTMNVLCQNDEFYWQELFQCSEVLMLSIVLLQSDTKLHAAIRGVHCGEI